VIAHDYLSQRGGAERLVLSLLKAFPGARLVTSVYEPSQTFSAFERYEIQTSPLNRVPVFRRDPRVALPLLAPVWSSLHVDDADVVLCSSSGWSHGIRTTGRKIVYCHNPARWLYQSQEYLAGSSASARAALFACRSRLRSWDQRQAATADLYLANSTTVQERIRRTYGIEARVVPPPAGVDVHAAQRAVPGLQPGFLLTVARDRRYKNTDAVCRALGSRPDRTLVVVGGLPEGRWPRNIIGLSAVPDAQLRWLYANCAALVAVSHEDFGLTVPEANSFGKPVVAWRSGGYLDTVVEGVNGYFVDEPTPEHIHAALERLESRPLSMTSILAHARGFSEATFIARIRDSVHDVYGGPQQQRDGSVVPLAITVPGPRRKPRELA
jgi:glycosyltransferase involved in cell wall biosynthesis